MCSLYSCINTSNETPVRHDDICLFNIFLMMCSDRISGFQGPLKSGVLRVVENERRLSMRKKMMIVSIFLVLLVICGYGYATLYAEYSPCNNTIGKVLNVVNDEFFTISVCDEIKEFREFSYCFNVEAGDTVIFNGNPDKCEVVSFTVARNDVQCGVFCRE